MNKIRIGVIGLRFGQYHVQTLANMPNAQLVAVADRNYDHPGGLSGFANKYGAKAYQDGMELMEKEELDAVSLCIPPKSREALIKAAANKKIAMFVEKPWATNMDHARLLAKLCEEKNAQVMLAFSFRFHPAITKLQELIKGELGQGWLLSGEYIFNMIRPANHWLWNSENGNGFFNENSVHLFDAVCSLLGDPISISAEGGVFLGSPSEEAAVINLRFKNKSIASLTCGGIGTGNYKSYPRIHLVTEKGEANLSGREHIWEKLEWTNRGNETLHSFTESPEKLQSTRYTHAFNHFFDCIQNNKMPKVSVRAGLMSTAIAMGIYESIKTGQKINLEY